MHDVIKFSKWNMLNHLKKSILNNRIAFEFDRKNGNSWIIRVESLDGKNWQKEDVDAVISFSCEISPTSAKPSICWWRRLQYGQKPLFCTGRKYIEFYIVPFCITFLNFFYIFIIILICNFNYENLTVIMMISFSLQWICVTILNFNICKPIKL